MYSGTRHTSSRKPHGVVRQYKKDTEHKRDTMVYSEGTFINGVAQGLFRKLYEDCWNVRIWKNGEFKAEIKLNYKNEVLEKEDPDDLFNDFNPLEHHTSPLLPELSNLTEHEINSMFDALLRDDAEVKEILGDDGDEYELAERLSIL
jgi:hypothetical protein